MEAELIIWLLLFPFPHTVVVVEVVVSFILFYFFSPVILNQRWGNGADTDRSGNTATVSDTLPGYLSVTAGKSVW